EGASLERIRARTLTGAVSALPGKVNALADFAQSQEQAHSELAASLDRCFSAADSVLAEVFSDGRVLHGEVNARWQDFVGTGDRKSTRLNSSHVSISYAVFCLKKKN